MRGLRVKALRSSAGFDYKALENPLARRAFRDVKDAFYFERRRQEPQAESTWTVPGVNQVCKGLGPRPYAKHWRQRVIALDVERNVGGFFIREVLYENCAVHVERPIKQIGAFFLELEEFAQVQALDLVDFAGRMPKHELDKYYWQLKNYGEIRG